MASDPVSVSGAATEAEQHQPGGDEQHLGHEAERDVGQHRGAGIDDVAAGIVGQLDAQQLAEMRHRQDPVRRLADPADAEQPHKAVAARTAVATPRTSQISGTAWKAMMTASHQRSRSTAPTPAPNWLRGEQPHRAAPRPAASR